MSKARCSDFQGPLLKVISGGQTGVDQAALAAAHYADILTGGTAPKGWRTLEGPSPWLEGYGMIESSSDLYSVRTEANVRDADATLLIADDFESPGMRCTFKAIRRHAKPYLAVGAHEMGLEATAREVGYWIRDNKIRVLNVAGNSERTSKGIHDKAEFFLRDVFTGWKVSAPAATTPQAFCSCGVVNEGKKDPGCAFHGIGK